jgi:hypothetical protein
MMICTIFDQLTEASGLIVNDLILALPNRHTLARKSNPGAGN